MAGLNHQSYRGDRTDASIGQVSSEPLEWTDEVAVTVGAASGTLLAAGAGVGRLVRVKVPGDAANGICIRRGAAAATTTRGFMDPGDCDYFSTEQAVQAIRSGAADVTVYVSWGVVA